MIAYGIQDVPMTAIPENITNAVKDPEEAAARMLILLSVAFCASNSDEADKIANWLKNEDLWQAASDNEKLFFRERKAVMKKKQNCLFNSKVHICLPGCLAGSKYILIPRQNVIWNLLEIFLQMCHRCLAETENLFENLAYDVLPPFMMNTFFIKWQCLYFKHIKKTDKENTSNVHNRSPSTISGT